MSFHIKYQSVIVEFEMIVQKSYFTKQKTVVNESWYNNCVVRKSLMSNFDSQFKSSKRCSVYNIDLMHKILIALEYTYRAEQIN